jgi:hypothetical protein
MEDDDAIPTLGQHRGVALEDRQRPARLILVRTEIDCVLGMTDPVELAAWAEDYWHSPESRRLVGAMAESMWELAAETPANRPQSIWRGCAPARRD